MSDSEDEYGIDKPLDDDYIDVESRRADLSTSEDESDDLDRSPDSAQRSDVGDERRTFAPSCGEAANVSTENVDMTHVFDVGGGAGSAEKIDDLIDENAVIENDGRSQTKTFFYPSEADGWDHGQAERLARLQDGHRSPERNEQNRAADRRRWAESFGAKLGCTDHQIERTKHIVAGMNMSHMGYYSSQKIILATISLVANEDGRFIRDEVGFKELMRDVETTMDELKQMRRLIRDKSDRL